MKICVLTTLLGYKSPWGFEYYDNCLVVMYQLALLGERRVGKVNDLLER